MSGYTNGNGERRDIKAFFQIIFNFEDWAKAKWSATVFTFGPDSVTSEVPGLGIGFADFDAGKKIFREWIERFGNDDKYNEFRVSIVEGPLEGKPPGYTVILSSNVDNTIKRVQEKDPFFNPEKGFFISKKCRMNPAPSSQNLARFKAAFSHFGKCGVFPVHVSKAGIVDVDRELYIEKNEVRFVHSSEITDSDPESVVFAKAK